MNFGSRSGSKTFLEVQPYLFVLNSAKFWAFFSFFESFGVISFSPLGLFFGSRSGSKTFLEPTNVDYQFLFWQYIPIFWFFIWPNFGPFFKLRQGSSITHFVGLSVGRAKWFGSKAFANQTKPYPLSFIRNKIDFQYFSYHWSSIIDE